MVKKVYISGPITGLPEKYVHATFEVPEFILKEQGFEVVNPLQACQEENARQKKAGLKEMVEHHEFMRYCIHLLATCDAICLVGHWQKSKGCLQEMAIAVALKLERINFMSSTISNT